MNSIAYPKNLVLGAPDVKAFPKTQYDKIVEIIDIENKIINGTLPINHTASVVNATATLTAAQVATGYIQCTSTAAVVMTMPTGTLLGSQLTAKAGTIFDLVIDNTASSGSGVVTMAVGVNNVAADYQVQITTATASVTPAAVTPLTVAVGVSGTAVYRFVFSSTTACTFSRIA